MRVLVLGGTAFIGRAAVERLLRRGHEVTLFHRGRKPSPFPRTVPVIRGDRRTLAGAAVDLAAVEADVVLDMIAFTESDAREAVETFRGRAARLVAASSMDVYRAYGKLNRLESGPPEPVPLDESSALRSRLYPFRGETPRPPGEARWLDDYEKIKVEEVYLASEEPRATVLRLPMVFGPGDYQHRLHPLLRRMDDGRPAVILEQDFARWRSAVGYVENVAHALVAAVEAEAPPSQVYNVAFEEAPSQEEWARAVGRAAGWDGRVAVLPAGRTPDHLRPALDCDHHLWADSSRLRRDLGFREPVPLEEALARAVAWERAHPPPRVDPKAFDYDAEDAALARAGPEA